VQRKGNRGPLLGRYGHKGKSSAKAHKAKGDPCKGATGTTFALAFHRQPLLLASASNLCPVRRSKGGTRRGNSSKCISTAEGTRRGNSSKQHMQLQQAQGEKVCSSICSSCSNNAQVAVTHWVAQAQVAPGHKERQQSQRKGTRGGTRRGTRCTRGVGSVCSVCY
jgi:hypothetical protein